MAKTPRPGIRKRGDSWCIYWRQGTKIKEIGSGAADEHEAETRRMEIELALRTGDWPQWAAAKAAVRRIIRQTGSTPEDTSLIDAYAHHAPAGSSTMWAEQSLRTLRNCGLDLASLDPAQASAWLDNIATTRSVSTRNRYLSILSKFYGWANRTGRLHHNPVEDLKTTKERDTGEDIVYLTKPERTQVLKAADKIPHGISVWLAILAGLRRQEIWRAERAHFDLLSGRATVQKTKKGIRRTLPIAKKLAARLKQEKSDPGRIVAWPDTYWPFCDAEQAVISALRKACQSIPKERISWTAFRHSFGSALAQAGVSLDKISAWMGNTPDVCRKHYAQFVPRDHRDTEIDRI